ncbi:MAG: cysteine desulfurase [Acidobacteria bacterium]|nr:cysteine desulfurase [Acidobacteriota bacterium]
MSAETAVAPEVFDIRRIRADFPILHQLVHGRPLVYLDNAATTQKPRAVIEAIEHFYARDNSNIHRGLHTLSERATFAYERARGKVRRFLNAAVNDEIVFTRGTTEALNLVAWTWGRKNVREGDEILISTMEHHSNIVPWQMLCEERGAKLKIVPIADTGELLFDEYLRMLSPRTKIVSIVQMSNALGTINPVKEIIEAAHAAGAVAVVDGAQGAPHLKVDVRALDADFYAFSGHKLFGPTGIGALYGKAALLEASPPFQGGGDMIASVTFEKTTYNKIPHKFEAGTPDIAGAIGLGAAIDYLESIGFDPRAAHERDLLEYATRQLSRIDGLTIVGTAPRKGSVVSFTLDGVHPHDIGTILDKQGVAVRAGHHCAQPLMDRLCLPATARASFAFYNTRDEVDALVGAIHRVFEVFR